MIPQPKPVKRVTVKRRRQRQARKVVQSVRAQCVERDGYCRASGMGRYGWNDGRIWRNFISLCHGQSEWAHLGEKKRFKTRRQAPEVRHTTAGSLMLCRFHHRAYDRGKLRIIGDDANRPLRFEWTR